MHSEQERAKNNELMLLPIATYIYQYTNPTSKFKLLICVHIFQESKCYYSRVRGYKHAFLSKQLHH